MDLHRVSSVNDKLSKSEDHYSCLQINKLYIINVAYLVNIVFVSICKKNHVIFYHLECICTAVNSVVKKYTGVG